MAYICNTYVPDITVLFDTCLLLAKVFPMELGKEFFRQEWLILRKELISTLKSQIRSQHVSIITNQYQCIVAVSVFGLSHLTLPHMVSSMLMNVGFYLIISDLI